MSDLRTNNVRGYLAEFLVAQAVGSTGGRVEWAPWDVTAPDGTRVEVKSSGYLQAWAQPELSTPSYQVVAAYYWDDISGTWSAEKTFNADVYVFALQTATSHEEYDPLQVEQWRFYVAGRGSVEDQAGARMSLPTLARVCGDAVAYKDLGQAIVAAAGGERD